MRHKNAFVSVAFTVLLATVAWAATVEELTSDAEGLRLQYVELQDRVDACPDGQCSEASAIVDEHATLHGKLDTLHADRAALGTCGDCGALDELIGSVDGIDDAVGMTLAGWDEVN